MVDDLRREVGGGVNGFGPCQSSTAQFPSSSVLSLSATSFCPLVSVICCLLLLCTPVCLARSDFFLFWSSILCHPIDKFSLARVAGECNSPHQLHSLFSYLVNQIKSSGWKDVVPGLSRSLDASAINHDILPEQLSDLGGGTILQWVLPIPLGITLQRMVLGETTVPPLSHWLTVCLRGWSCLPCYRMSSWNGWARLIGELYFGNISMLMACSSISLYSQITRCLEEAMGGMRTSKLKFSPN